MMEFARQPPRESGTKNQPSCKIGASRLQPFLSTSSHLIVRSRCLLGFLLFLVSKTGA